MRLIYLAPGLGRGKCVRAAAVLRRVERPALVVLGLGQIPDALDRVGVAYVQVADPERYVWEHEPDALVVDCRPRRLPAVPRLTIGRLDRPRGDFSAEQPLPFSLEDEVLSREDAAELVGGTGTIYVGSWQPGDSSGMLAAPDVPACRWLAAADHVVGYPGCNLFWQVTGCGVPATWLSSSVPDQQLRSRRHGPGAGAPTGYRPPPQAGVEELARRIDAL